MTPSKLWRRRIVAPMVATVAMLGGGAALQAVNAGSAGAATPVTTETEFRNAWANDADVVLGADINLTCFEKSAPGGSEALRDLAGDGTLDGQGHTITQTCPETRVLQITGETGNMTIQNVTITGGQAVFGTTSGNGGGGIQSTVESGLTIINSSISGNATCEGGGGIEMDYSGELSVSGSTFANNIADEGGGIANYGSSVSAVNSTFTGNSSTSTAGGIWAEGDLTLVYSTVTQNTVGVDVPLNCNQAQSADGHARPAAVDGADNLEVDGTFSAFGNIVAQPGGGNDNCLIESANSSGYNFSDDTTCGFDAATDSASPANVPNLGALGANGGPTPTLLPLTGSPVIDAIPHVNCGDGDSLAQTVILSDQRGFGRPEVSGGNCDIGAVEVQTTPEPTPSPAVIIAPRFTG
jgi:hypothetical protein